MHANADPVRPPPGRPAPPAGPDALEARLALGIAGLFCLAPFPDAVPRLVVAAATLPLAAIAIGRRRVAAVHVAAVLVPALVLFAVPGLSSLWPAPLLLALAGYAAAVRFVPELGGRPAWASAGRIAPADVLLAVAFVVVACAALTLWNEAARPDLAEFRARIPAGLSAPALIGVGLAFATLNAIAEETVFRGVLQEALGTALRSPWLALTLQAVAFGILHAQGFPNGWSGVGLAAIYGAMMGVLRLRTGGLALPIAAHVVADATIFAILAGPVS